jgi:hypothetical protein
MFKRLHSLLERFRPLPTDHEIERLIMRTIRLVDPRLTLMPDFPRRYRPLVSRARDYAQTLAEQVPGPEPANHHGYATSPIIHTLFPAASVIDEAITRSDELKRALLENTLPGSDRFLALLASRRRDRQTFGFDLVGDSVQRDVAQTLVYFQDHTLTLPASDLTNARDLLRQHFIDSLFLRVADQIRQDSAERQSLELERLALLTQRRAATPDRKLAIDLRIAEIEANAKRLAERLQIDRYTEYINHVLNQPETYLRLEHQTLNIDSMGIKRNPDDHNAAQLDLVDLICRDRRRWTITLVELQRKDVVSLLQQQHEAMRWLTI